VNALQSKTGEVGSAVKAAIEAGYRHIDTAYIYRNEAAIGSALKEVLAEGKLRREDLFITSKVCVRIHWRPVHFKTYVSECVKSAAALAIGLRVKGLKPPRLCSFSPPDFCVK